MPSIEPYFLAYYLRLSWAVFFKFDGIMSLIIIEDFGHEKRIHRILWAYQYCLVYTVNLQKNKPMMYRVFNYSNMTRYYKIRPPIWSYPKRVYPIYNSSVMFPSVPNKMKQSWELSRSWGCQLCWPLVPTERAGRLNEATESVFGYMLFSPNFGLLNNSDLSVRRRRRPAETEHRMHRNSWWIQLNSEEASSRLFEFAFLQTYFLFWQWHS